MKEMFLDIGELGWSFYLSAHMRWLKENGNVVPAVMVVPGREALYKDIAPAIFQVPAEFHKDFSGRSQNCFVLYGVTGDRLRTYFNSRLPENYVVSKSQPLGCSLYNKIYVGKKLYIPYVYETKLKGKKEILVFPRMRKAFPFKMRNLSEHFYISLIKRLCDENRDYTIRTMGTLSGAYSITKEKVPENNYVNSVGETSSLQAVIDRCQVAICTVGGTSALPKLAMLQGVPSFIVGHEDARFKVEENWRRTKVGFYHISHLQYGTFDFKNCIEEIISFIKEVCNEARSNQVD